MDDQVARLFRRLTLLCLLGVGGLATLTYLDLVPARMAVFVVAGLAVLLFLFDTLADDSGDVPHLEAGVSRLLALKAISAAESLPPEAEASADQSNLAAMLQTNPQLVDLVNNSSHQLYLIKLRGYLVRQIKTEYERSTMDDLVGELKQVEAELETLAVEYSPLDIPDRFRQLITSFDRQKRLQVYCGVIDALPFLPFKAVVKLYLRVVLR